MSSTPAIRQFTLFVLAGAVVLFCRGAVDLTPNSPFMPPGGNGSADVATPPSSPVELHGIVATPDGYKFDLFDAANHKDTWVGFNETGKPYVVHSHDIAHNRITVEYEGREFTLTLPQAKIAPMGPGTVMNMPPPVMRSPMTPPQAGVTPAMNSEDERRRIELITEEIRRRRALRAAQQRQQFQPPTPGQPGAPTAR